MHPELQLMAMFAAASLQARVQTLNVYHSPATPELLKAAWKDAYNMLQAMPDLAEGRLTESLKQTMSFDDAIRAMRPDQG